MTTGVAELEEAALAAVSAEDVREMLRLSPPELVQAVLDVVHLGGKKKASPAVAQQVLRTMRHGGSKRRNDLRFFIGGVFVHGFRNADGLEADDCAKLLGESTAAEVLERAPRLRELLALEAPVAIVRWGLVRAVQEDRPTAVVALGLLAAEPVERMPGARAMWESVRENHPALPGRPVGVLELREIAGRGPGEAVPTPERLAMELDELRGRFSDAADAADRTAVRLREGRRPEDGDLLLIQRAAADLDEVRERIDAVIPGERPAGLPALAAAVQGAMEDGRRNDRVRALRSIEGPQFVAELLEEVREAAAGEANGGLAALAELIGTRKEEPLRAPGLAEKARAELPPHWRPLVDVALMGDLAVARNPGDAVAPPPPDETEAREAADGPPDVVVPAPREVPEVETVPVPGSADVVLAGDEATPAVDDELAELDAFLEGAIPSSAVPVRRVEPTGTPPEPSGIRGEGGDGAAPIGAPSAPEPPSRTRTPAASPREANPTGASLAGASPAGASPAEANPAEANAPEATPGEAGDAGRGVVEVKDPAEAEVSGRLVEAEAAAFDTGRFGLAGWLRKAAGRPDAEVNARWCAALAPEMAVFAGPLSAEFAAMAGALDAKALADDPAGGLLAWAAAIRAGLVYPEATRLAEHLNVVVSRHAVLKECGEAFAQAARAGLYLSPGMDGWIRGAAGLAEARRAASRDAARLLAEAPHRTIKLARATEVWKALLLKDGEIRRLLRLAEENDPARAAEVAAEVVRLRGGDAVERLIDRTDARVNGPKKGKPIIAGARAKLHARIDDALDTAGRWAAAVKEHGDAASGDHDWRAGPLRQLREAIGERRRKIDDAFAALAGASGEPAAVRAARGLLDGAFELLDGRELPGTEPGASHLRNRDLLPAAGVPVDPRSFEPARTPSLDVLARVALAGTPDWEEVFEARAERRDHEGTEAVVTVLRALDADAAARLRARRGELVARARAARDGRAEEIRDLVARSLRDGLLTEDQGARAEETLRRLTGDRDDFAGADAALDALTARLDAQRAARVDAERARLAEQAERFAAADVARIGRHVEAGDLTTAREFLAQLEAGNQLPEKPGENDFGRFYPAFPEAFHRFAVRAGNRARKQETGEYIEEIKEALVGGRDVTEPDLERLLADAGIRIPDLRNAARKVASEGLRKWLRLRDQGMTKTAGNLRSIIDAVLKTIGLEGRQQDAGNSADRLWIDLDGVQYVAGQDKTLLPAFGTQMSPSGDRLRLLLVWRRPGPQQLTELLKDQPESQTVLVLYFGVLSADDRRELARAARGRPAPVAGVLDDAAIAYLACHPQDWSATVAVMAPFTATDPYAPNGEVPDEMFYGRSDQLRRVTDRNGPSFVYGGRQLGKSALLRKAERSILDTDPHRTVILENIQTVGKGLSNSLWPTLADRLAKAGVIRRGVTGRDQVVDAVRAWAEADPNRQLLVLLDEADRFLNEDAEGGRFEDVTTLRNLMMETGRRIKVVWAGLHQTARFESLPNQPLAHLGDPIAVGPLDPQDAFDLLVRPLALLGYVFPETLAARVIAEANNAPALVQLFAGKLLARLREDPKPPPQEITPEDVAGVWRDKKLARGFRDRFEWTLNLDKRYKVIAYTVALNALADGADAALTVKELREECRYWWAKGFEDCTGDGFRSLLEECVNLGVLGVDADRYRLRTPHILNLLGGVREVENVLENAADFEDPDQFDAHSYRMVFKDGPERSPLSLGQLAGLLRPRPLVHVVTGSAALHAERVAASLEGAPADRPGLRVKAVRRGDGTLAGALRRARMSAGHDVIVLDLHTGPRDQFERRLAEAREAVADRSGEGTLSIVLVAGPPSAAAWVRAVAGDDVELVELRRFDAPAIRQWMWEDSLGFPDDGGQRELIRRTGGWPTLVGRVVTGLAGPGRDRDQALENVVRQVRDRPGAFVDGTGVRADPCLAAAWRVLAAQNAPETPEDLAVFLTLFGEDRTPGLTPDDLRDHGYDGTHDLVDALRALGALEPADGGLACEPVLAEASRRAAGA